MQVELQEELLGERLLLDGALGGDCGAGRLQRALDQLLLVGVLRAGEDSRDSAQSFMPRITHLSTEMSAVALDA